MTHIELLAPARTADIGIEAVRHGADAVYIGAPVFGARAAAGNSVADIARLTTFAHQYGARVYVTVNTIIYDEELPQAEKLCWQLWEARVDALIVQDLRVLSLRLPPIPLHASTQMDNRTAEKVQRLAALGFPQVVLARELATEEIRAIHEAVPEVTLEVFVHGALCVSLSGRCNASEALFHRSANRGECAQVCRMEMDLLEDGVPVLRNKHLLSLRDNCQLANLEELLLAGASSLKIEGRLKDMAYVKNITAAYSQALDAVIARHPDKFRRRSAGHVRLTFQPSVWKSFNRGFVKDVSQPDANIDTPKSMGEPLVEMKNEELGMRNKGARTKHEERSMKNKPDGLSALGGTRGGLHNGDGLCYLDEGGKLVGFRVNNAAEFRPRKGVQYYRNFDVEWEKLLASPTAERRIWADIDVYDDRITMTAEDGCSVSIAINFPAYEPANTPQAKNVRRQLSKLGGTLYEARHIGLRWTEERFVPSSQLAAWRRGLVEMLDAARRDSYQQAVQPHEPVRLETEKPYELTHDPTTPLMLTKYCLRRQLGQCLKEGARPADWALHLKNGRVMQLAFDCRACMMRVLPLLCAALLLVGCMGGSDSGGVSPVEDTIVNIVDTAQIQPDSALLDLTPQQVDSLVFRLTHHYSENFNFVVKADSLTLLPREGDLVQDTCRVFADDIIAVAAIQTLGDTVWVKVAHDQQTMGWIAEQELLAGVAPDDPISEMLYWLQSWRGIWMSVLASIGLIAFFLHQRKSRQIELLRAEELDSPYPLLFIALVALMASLYASVQNFVPEFWQEYYYHPSLNPLILPPVMALLVVLMWLVIITFIAVCDEVYHHFYFLPGVAYLFELVGIAMIVYLAVSWITLFYVGYLLLPLLLYALVKQYRQRRQTSPAQ